MADEYLLAVGKSGDLNPAQATELRNQLQAEGIPFTEKISSRGTEIIPSGGAGASSVDQFASDLFEAQKETFERETKWLEQYTVENPFAFDEALAKESATQEYQPYYSELLEDYLQGVDLQRETIQDEQKLLTTLYQMGTGERSRSYQRAVSRAEEGFAGQGMFYSGIKKRALGEAEVEYKAGEREAEERYGAGARGYERQEKALTLEEEQRRRDIARQQEEAVAGGVETRRGEAMTQYYTPFVQAYQRQFPTGTQGIEGYLPPSFLQYRY